MYGFSHEPVKKIAIRVKTLLYFHMKDQTIEFYNYGFAFIVILMFH